MVKMEQKGETEAENNKDKQNEDTSNCSSKYAVLINSPTTQNANNGL